MSGFNGLGMHLGNLARLSSARTRSISAENFTGEKGKGGMATEGTGASRAGDLGPGWKISPSVRIGPGETFELADIREPGAIQHIWMTPTGPWRFSILASIGTTARPFGRVPRGRLLRLRVGLAQCPLTPCASTPERLQLLREMPFRKRCRMTMTNLGDEAMTSTTRLTTRSPRSPTTSPTSTRSFGASTRFLIRIVHTILMG